MKKIKSIFLVVILTFIVSSVISSCGGGGLSGKYIAKDSMTAVAFSSFEFKGNKVIIGMVGGMMQYTVPYTYTKGTNGNPGTLSLDLSNMAGSVGAGMASNMPCEFDGNTMKLGGFEYVKQ